MGGRWSNLLAANELVVHDVDETKSAILAQRGASDKRTRGSRPSGRRHGQPLTLVAEYGSTRGRRGRAVNCNGFRKLKHNR